MRNGLLLLILLNATLPGQEALVRVPGTSSTVTDPVTGIPVRFTLAPFLAGATEVTQAEYAELMGTNPSARKGEALPVTNVSWWNAIDYCNRLSRKEKRQPCYDLITGGLAPRCDGYRLLTDAEWSHAAGSAEESPAANAHLGPAGTKDTAPLVEWARTEGPEPVRSRQANAQGLHHMTGNVWEWVQDRNDTTGGVFQTHNPQGPATGPARVVRGGSWMSTSSRWAKGYRSSMEPDRASPYTGFRVARSLPPDSTPQPSAEWYAPYQQAPAAFAQTTGKLTSLTQGVANRQQWEPRRSEIEGRWRGILGLDACPEAPVSAKVVSRDSGAYFTGELAYLQVEPDYREKIYVMLPAGQPVVEPLPVVIVPYYDVDVPAGQPLGGRTWTPIGTRAFAHLAVQQDFAAIAIRWFGESYGENYSEAVANLKLRHPKLTGLGKWVCDSKRLLDYIATRPELDSSRIGMIGHSLGGKMTLYATAMDPRIKVAVSSEPGIGLTYSNYEDFWYLGEEFARIPAGTDHHELLALAAPRPFLLIGGDSADNDSSWHYINAAREVYRLFQNPNRIGYVNHRQGHSPTPESVHLAMEWLARHLRSAAD